MQKKINSIFLIVLTSFLLIVLSPSDLRSQCKDRVYFIADYGVYLHLDKRVDSTIIPYKENKQIKFWLINDSCALVQLVERHRKTDIIKFQISKKCDTVVTRRYVNTQGKKTTYFDTVSFQKVYR